MPKQTIWKFSLQPTVPMPKGARVLAVQVQNSEAQLWAVVDPGEPVIAREFVILGTGDDLPEELGSYIGTFQMLSGSLIFHVFDKQGDAK